MIRAISHTEAATLLDCQARWDFRYGNRLAGSSLRPKDTPVLLREGRAWGRGVATYHETGNYGFGRDALLDALDEDAKAQQEVGFYDPGVAQETEEKLTSIFEHYASEVEPLSLASTEHELLIPLPSRSGKGDSSRYRLQVFFDGVHEDEEGRVWLVEFKLRKQLSSLELIANSRQIRYYAWAWRREHGAEVAGVIVDEALNAAPKEPRVLKGNKPSHAKDQLTTDAAYEALCTRLGEEPKLETIEALASRRWSQRHRIFLSAEEIAESGTELISLGEQVRDADGSRYPVRNVKPQTCNGCSYREICNTPQDTSLVDSLFERVSAKRDRDEEETPA